MSKSQTLFPNKTATVVVHPTPGIGDVTTIAEAMAVLAIYPAGGEILLREGTYTPPATVTLPVAKPVVVRGCGTSTVISLGANAVCAFSLPDGYTVNTPVEFCDFKVTGTEVANQGVVASNDTKSLSEIYLSRVDTVGVEQFVQVNAGSFQDATPGQDDVKIHMEYCRIRPITTDTSVIIKNTFGGFNYIRVWMREVQFMGDSISAVPGGRSDPLWGNIADDNFFGDLNAEDCDFSIGGDAFEVQYSNIFAVNSQFINNDSTVPCVHGYTNGSPIGTQGSNFRGCVLKRVSFDHFGTATYTGCTLDGFHCVTWEPTTFQGCIFQNTNGSPYPFNTPGDDPFIIENFATGSMVIGCLWANFDSVPTGLVNGIQASMIEIFGEMQIIGNDFDDVDPPVTIGIIEVFSGNCVFVGNRFPFAPTSGPPMKDWNGSNYYANNPRLHNDGNGITIKPPAGDGFDPTKGCLGNTFNGVRSWTGTGFTGGTATNQRVVVYQNPNGLAQTKGYLHNTGANTITVTERYTGVNQGPFTRTTVLTAGSKMPLDPFDFTGLDGSLDQQVWRYEVLLSGTTIGWTTYFPAPGSLYTN